MLVVVSIASSCSSDDAADESGSASSTTTSSTTTPRLDCDQPVIVGVVTDLSGGLQLLGRRTAYGISAGFAHAGNELPGIADEQTYRIEDCEIRVILADDQSSDQRAEFVATELVETSGADVLIGASSPSATAAVQQVAELAEVVFLAVIDTPDGITGAGFHPTTFLVAESVDQEAAAVCGDGDVTEVAVLAMDYPVGRRRGEAYADVCGASVTLLPSATTGFVDAVTALGQPDLAVLAWEGSALRSLVTTAAGSDLESVSLGALPPSDLVPVFLSEANGMQAVAAHPLAESSNPSARFLRQHAERTPDALDTRGMNAALLVVAALRKTSGDAGAEPLIAALEGLQVEGPNGEVAMRAADHLLVQDLHVVVVTDAATPTYEVVRTVRPEPSCRLPGEPAGRCG